MNIRFKHSSLLAALVAASVLATGASAAPAFVVYNLATNVPGAAGTTDPALVDPWGMTTAPNSPFWIGDQSTGVSTLYDGAGVKNGGSFTVPGPNGAAANFVSSPTGVIWNPTPGSFLVPGAKKPATFIFATLDGTISAWTGGLATNPTTAVLAVDNSAAGAQYRGLAYGNTTSGNYLYAANFTKGTVDVFDQNFAAATLAGTFADPNLPSGFAPFNVANINGNIWVTYAQQDATKRGSVAGPGAGVVNVFNTDGQFLARFATGNDLNAPWGIVPVPYGWTQLNEYAGMILIGNFGDGTVHVYGRDGSNQGTLSRANGLPVIIPGLWAMQFGGGRNSNPQTLYLTAGIGNGTLGLFGSLVPTSP